MTSDDQVALVRWAWRGLIGLLLSASLVAAISFLWSHGEGAVQSVAEVVPRLDAGSTTPAERPEPGLPAAARATADAALAPAAPPSRSMPDNDKPAPAPVPPELAELMRKVDRNIAGLAQAVTDLRLAHQQATGDNVKSVEDIRASLDQISRAMASAPETPLPAQVAQPKPPSQVTQAKPAAPAMRASPPAQVTQAKPLTQVTQAKPLAPAPQPAARRNRRYVPPYMSPSDALGFMR